MASIFTRRAVGDIMGNEALTPEQRTEQVFSLYGRALEDGYLAKAAAQAAAESAVAAAREQWARERANVDVTQSGEYRALASAFEAYRAMQAARTAPDYADVKPKFFETVYGMVDRTDGAKPVEEQLADIRERFEEYFSPAQRAGATPRFAAPLAGSMPRGTQGASEAFCEAWGFGK